MYGVADTAAKSFSIIAADAIAIDSVCCNWANDSSASIFASSFSILSFASCRANNLSFSAASSASRASVLAGACAAAAATVPTRNDSVSIAVSAAFSSCEPLRTT